MPTTASAGAKPEAMRSRTPAFGIILGAFDGSAERGVASGDEGADQGGRGVEGGRALGGIENAQAAAGAGAHVDKITAMIEGRDDRVNGLLDPREFAGHRRRNLGVGGVHRGQDAASPKGVERMPFCQLTLGKKMF